MKQKPEDTLKHWKTNRINSAISKEYEGVAPYTETELKESKATPYQEALNQTGAKLRKLLDKINQALP